MIAVALWFFASVMWYRATVRIARLEAELDMFEEKQL
jgi:hypothetical protein